MYEMMLAGLVGIVGLCFGSFFNVLADRWSFGEGIGGRSHCDNCGMVLRPLMMIPVISFLVMKGRSLCCKSKLSWWYVGSEILTAVSFMALFVYGQMEGFSLNEYMIHFTILGLLLIILFADVKYKLIPQPAVGGLVLVTLIFNMTLGQARLVDHAYAGLVLFAAMWGLYWLVYRIYKQEGIGFGDVELAFCAGWLLGLMNGFLALYIAFVVGGLASVVLIIGKKSGMKTKIAFGPFILLGMGLMLWWPALMEGIIKRLF